MPTLTAISKVILTAFFLLSGAIAARGGMQDLRHKYPPTSSDAQVSLESKVKAHEQFLNEATDYFERAIILTCLAHDYQFHNNYPKALQYLNEVGKLLPHIQNEAFVVDYFATKGNTYSMAGMWKEALAAYQQAMKTAKEADDQRNSDALLAQIAAVYTQLGDYKTSSRTFQEAISNMKAHGNDEDLHKTLINYSSDLLFQGQAAEAIPYIRQAISLFEEKRDISDLAKAYGNLAYAEGLLKNYPEAFKNYEKSIALAKEIKANDILWVSYQDMSDTYAAAGDHAAALKHYRTAIALRDSLMGSEKQKEIAAMEAKFEQELGLKELEKQVSRRNSLILVAALSLALTILILIKLRGDRRRDREIHAAREHLMSSQLEIKALETAQIEAKYQTQREDIRDLALDITRRDSLSELVEDDLNEILKLPPTQQAVGIQTLLRRLQSHRSIDVEKTALHENIEQVNHEFYQTLEEKFGSLTPAEKELCALIRLNMTNKNIANIKGISPASVKMARYRLRKRLDLAEDTDIVAFLQSL